MFSWFNKTKTTSTKNNLKVRVQVEVEIEESIGKLITGGEKDFQFNTDKKTAITASIAPLKSPEIVSELYKVISQVVVEEFNIDRSVLNEPEKIIVESKPFKMVILIFNVIVHPQTILDRIVERLSETTVEPSMLVKAEKTRRYADKGKMERERLLLIQVLMKELGVGDERIIDKVRAYRILPYFSHSDTSKDLQELRNALKEYEKNYPEGRRGRSEMTWKEISRDEEYFNQLINKLRKRKAMRDRDEIERKRGKKRKKDEQ